MPSYRIHRLKEGPREGFRWAAHTGGVAVVKPKDYEAAEEMEAANPYQTWKLMLELGAPLHPGDVLELVTVGEAGGELKIVKYIGFEPAQWFIPEPKPNVVVTSEYPPSPIRESAQPNRA